MPTITAGNPVTLDATFGQEGQPSPTGVVFEIEQPDQVVVVFTWNVDAEVTSPVPPNYFECALGVLQEVGEYTWRAIGTSGSAVSETIYGTIYVIPSAVDPEQTVPPGPTLGPNVIWITGEDVANCARVEYGSNPAIFDTVAYEASMALYEISGRQFPGLTERRARPCMNGCNCWLTGPYSYGMGPWFWTSVPWGFGGGWAWYNERGDKFGCQPMSKINLAGYPVREILGVTIDGVDLPEFDPTLGFRNWRLDKWRYLVRMDQPNDTSSSPEIPAQPRFWPSCQNMSLDADQPGTFEIHYRWGVSPPPLGIGAAIEIANQLFLACGGRECVLPVGATKVTRQGIEIDRGLLANWADTTRGVGLVQTDLFLQAYNGGMRRGRRAAIWSPDLQFMARKVGTGSGS